MSETLDERANCPFCESDETETMEHVHGGFMFWVFCNNCGAEGPHDNTSYGAEEKWNNRADGWVSVDERLPEAKKRESCADCLIFEDTTYCGYFWVKTQTFTNDCDEIMRRVTHWQPLPSPPKEQG